jgi:hypothetical protein
VLRSVNLGAPTVTKVVGVFVRFRAPFLASPFSAETAEGFVNFPFHHRTADKGGDRS